MFVLNFITWSFDGVFMDSTGVKSDLFQKKAFVAGYALKISEIIGAP